MNTIYCNEECSTGKEAKKYFLSVNNSVFSAINEFNYFVKDCIKTCPYTDKHCINRREIK